MLLGLFWKKLGDFHKIWEITEVINSLTQFSQVDTKAPCKHETGTTENMKMKVLS